MKYILFDTNVYLALIFPLDTWKTIVEEPLEEVFDLIKKGEIKIVCPDFVFYEVNNRIDWTSEKFNEEFYQIYNELKNLNGPFTKNNILYFRKVMEHRIFTIKDTKIRNRLYYIESLILKEIKENPKLQVVDVLTNCIELFNEINVRLVGEYANYNIKYEIDKINFPKNKENDPEFIKILDEVKKSVNKEADAKIISIFIYFIRENKAKGIVVTHDFEHLLLNSIALEAIFDDIFIVRPGYVKCLIN